MLDRSGGKKDAPRKVGGKNKTTAKTRGEKNKK
jgi:hypothetical protein